MIQDTVVIGGECSLETRIEGDCDLTSMVEGDPDVLVVEGGGQTYPHYSGSYTVNPSTSQQVLQTDGKVMDDDVTIEAVQAGSATTPQTIITANPSISVSSGGLITATVSKTQQITPTVQEGYVSAGTAGNVGVSGSNTEQLSVQGAQTIHPASTDQSIASGKYLTGAQTIKGVTVTGLTADKVLQGTTVEIGDADDSDRIMKVVGTATGGGKVTKTLTNILGNSTTLVQGFFANNGTISAPVSPRDEVTTDFIDISAYQGQQIYFWSKTGGRVSPWVTLFWYNSEKTSISSRVSTLVTGNNAYTWNSSNTGFCCIGDNLGSFASGSLITVPSTAVYLRASFRTGGAGMMCAVLASEITPYDYWSREIDELAFVNAIESDGSAT